jgi:hypothetical protein
MKGHFSTFPWFSERWPNFTPAELSCPCCGEMFYDPHAFDALQRVRTELDQQLKINSAHRCALHNRRVGGAARSMHKQIAFDMSLRGQDPLALLRAARRAGFTGYGYYGTFLHVDLGKPRSWHTKEGLKKWAGLLTSSR